MGTHIQYFEQKKREENIKMFHLTIFIFAALKRRCIIHWYVCVMLPFLLLSFTGKCTWVSKVKYKLIQIAKYIMYREPNILYYQILFSEPALKMLRGHF